MVATIPAHERLLREFLELIELGTDATSDLIDIAVVRLELGRTGVEDRRMSYRLRRVEPMLKQNAEEESSGQTAFVRAAWLNSRAAPSGHEKGPKPFKDSSPSSCEPRA